MYSFYFYLFMLLCASSGGVSGYMTYREKTRDPDGCNHSTFSKVLKRLPLMAIPVIFGHIFMGASIPWLILRSALPWGVGGSIVIIVLLLSGHDDDWKKRFKKWLSSKAKELARKVREAATPVGTPQPAPAGA